MLIHQARHHCREVSRPEIVQETLPDGLDDQQITLVEDASEHVTGLGGLESLQIDIPESVEQLENLIEVSRQ